MNAVRLASCCNVGAIVHQNFRSARIRELQNLPGQLSELASGQIALPDLHQFDTFFDPVRYVRQPVRLVLRIRSVRNEAANHNYWVELALAR